MAAFAQWLAATTPSHVVRQALWLIPLLQAVHILAIAIVLSSVAMIGASILGFGAQTVAEAARRFVPWIWAALAVLAATGLTLIIGEPQRSLPNPAFQLKMAMLAVAVAVMLAFQVSLRRNGAFWQGGRHVGGLAVLTFGLWCAVAVAGRLIAYLRVAE
jgi:hypothetical protein